MKTLSISDFRNRCPLVLEELVRDRIPIVITKSGKPIAKLVPIAMKRAKLIGRLEGIISIRGDIESSIEPPDAWDSARH